MIDNKYLKITAEALFEINNSPTKGSVISNEEGLCLFSTFNTKTIFQEMVKERLLLVQKYSKLDTCVENCIPFLTNDQIYGQFLNPEVTFKKKQQQAELTLNSAIPYFFVYLLFCDLTWDNMSSNLGALNAELSIKSNPKVHENNTYGIDNTLFLTEKATLRPYELLEVLYYDENGQVEYNIKKNQKSQEYLISSYDKNNKTKESFTTDLQKLKNGNYKLFDKSGEIFIQGSYQNGQKNGTWQTSFGKEILGEINYKKGVPANSYEVKFSNGGIKTKVELDDSGNGHAKSFYKSGLVQLEGEYKNYRRIKTWKLFDMNQNTIAEIDYNLFGEKKQVITYYDNQAKHFEVFFMQNLIDGKVSEYYINGKLKGEYQFEKGIPSPQWSIFNPEGKLSGLWSIDNSFTGTLKALNEDMGIKYSFRMGESIILSHVALSIEAKLNILYSRTIDHISTSTKGKTVSNLPELTTNMMLRGENKSDIITSIGMISDKNQIKESIFYLINSWNNQLSDFVDNSSNDSFFIMNNQIIYKFIFVNDKVKSTEFLEFSNELF